MVQIGFVIPCFNEAEAISITVGKLEDKIQTSNSIDPSSLIVCVDDGSLDQTWAEIKELTGKYHNIVGIKLSRNFGHQNALLAGYNYVLSHTKMQAAISLDADMQDDIAAIERMVDDFIAGNEIVYGVRNNRDKDTLIKKTTAKLFYKLLKVLKINIIRGHADFRLVSKKALGKLSMFSERDPFLRAMFPAMGFKNSRVYYKRLERKHGYSKYPFMKMLLFAISGITSYSVAPIRVLTFLGLGCLVITMFLSVWALIAFVLGGAVHGWSSLILSIYFLGSIQLIGLGIVGEYIGRTYLEAKKRPQYILDECISSN